MKQLLVILFISAAIFAGCNAQKTPATEQKSEIKSEVKSIVRTKDTKVAELDLNKDNKVFQCPMDYDVISDKQEPCPKCKMDLDEVSVADAQNNLK